MVNNEFNALMIVIFVALACIGLVSTVGALFVQTKPYVVECTVEIKKGHVWVGKGEIF